MSTAVTIAPKESVIEEIGDFFENLFDPQAKLYNSLTEVEKQAATWGSTVIAAINKNLDAKPDDLATYITKTLLPTIDPQNLQGFLDVVQKTVDPSNTTAPLTLSEAIAWAQGYLKKFDGGIWEKISSTAAGVFAIILSPETPIEKLDNVIVLIYHTIVKPNVVTLAPAAINSIEPPSSL